jgi:hypothetical protein
MNKKIMAGNDVLRQIEAIDALIAETKGALAGYKKARMVLTKALKNTGARSSKMVNTISLPAQLAKNNPLIRIPAGEFIIGDNDESDNQPQEVYIKYRDMLSHLNSLGYYFRVCTNTPKALSK